MQFGNYHQFGLCIMIKIRRAYKRVLKTIPSKNFARYHRTAIDKPQQRTHWHRGLLLAACPFSTACPPKPASMPSGKTTMFRILSFTSLPHKPAIVFENHLYDTNRILTRRHFYYLEKIAANFTANILFQKNAATIAAKFLVLKKCRKTNDDENTIS